MKRIKFVKAWDVDRKKYIYLTLPQSLAVKINEFAKAAKEQRQNEQGLTSASGCDTLDSHESAQ